MCCMRFSDISITTLYCYDNVQHVKLQRPSSIKHSQKDGEEKIQIENLILNGDSAVCATRIAICSGLRQKNKSRWRRVAAVAYHTLSAEPQGAQKEHSFDVGGVPLSCSRSSSMQSSRLLVSPLSSPRPSEGSTPGSLAPPLSSPLPQPLLSPLPVSVLVSPLLLSSPPD